jgi:hypothetical protein
MLLRHTPEAWPAVGRLFPCLGWGWLDHACPATCTVVLMQACLLVQGLAFGFILLRVESLAEEGKI